MIACYFSIKSETPLYFQIIQQVNKVILILV